MRLLFVSERLPWPPDGGAAVRILTLLRALADGHEVDLLAFGEPGAVAPAGLRLGVTTVASPGEATAGDWLRDADGSPLPWSVRARQSAEMAAAVAERSRGADAVVATGLAMAQYLDSVRGPTRVYDALDVESITLAQVARLGVGPLERMHAAREAAAVESYERDLGRRADLIATVTEVDAAALRELAPEVPARAVPIGVPAGEYPVVWRPGTPRIAFFGDLGWPPNADAATHLCEDVLPRLAGGPQLVLAGRRPAPRLRALADPGVEVTGAVPEMARVLAGDTVAVAPLRAGTGMRVKLLEAMAWGLPVVSSTLGCAGIEHGGAIVVADGVDATVAAIDDLLADVDRRRELSEAGRRVVIDRYGLEASGERLIAGIESVQAGTGASRL